MNFLRIKNEVAVKREMIPDITPEKLSAETARMCNDQKRIVSLFGNREGAGVRIYSVLADDEISYLYVSSALVKEGGSYPSIAQHFLSAQLFEREIYEEFGIIPEGHPWLKPVRYPENAADKNLKMEEYPFFIMEGNQVHEVAVGPVHAGVIEPGHFRFMCTGEKVHHLEIQLGYQHRGVEKLMKEKDSVFLSESIAGDTVIGHSLAYCSAKEALSGTEVSDSAQAVRAVMLELERAAVHIGDLSALAGDIAYLPGNAVFGAIRTMIINTSLAICGSRFGRGIIRPGGVVFGIDGDMQEQVNNTLDVNEKKIDLMCSVMFEASSVLSRMQTTGVVDKKTAEEIGMTGMAARASGYEVDSRADHPFGAYTHVPVHKRGMKSGDVFARAYLRYVEIKQSFKLIRELMDYNRNTNLIADMKPQQPSMFVVSLTEGWRGEISHCAITDKGGKIERYKIKDPSFNNWLALALAVRGNGISDFPLCNKSFNLSYCGFDL